MKWVMGLLVLLMNGIILYLFHLAGWLRVYLIVITSVGVGALLCQLGMIISKKDYSNRIEIQRLIGLSVLVMCLFIITILYRVYVQK